MRGSLGIHSHRPELEASERTPLVANAPLAEKHWPSGAANYHQRHASSDEKPTRSHGQNEEQVEHSLPGRKPGRWFTSFCAGVLLSHISVPQIHRFVLIQYLRAFIIRQRSKTATPMNTESASVELRKVL
jgi:hypothetical protein